MGSKTLPKKKRTRCLILRGGQGGGCRAWGSCSWDFLSNVGELPFLLHIKGANS